VSVVVWLLAAVAAAALAAAAALIVALRLARARSRASEGVLADARATVAAIVDQEATAHAEELRALLRRTRADWLSLLVEEERRIAAERRGELAERERAADEYARLDRPDEAAAVTAEATILRRYLV
jgi:hypothetical protein